MHGRVKTRTTAEQNEAKRLEREKKVKAYKSAMKIIFEKRSSNVFDQESLDIISNLLLANPDIITLWNYRREIYLNWKKEQDAASIQKIIEKDLGFTEHCLKVNPKSYGTWHHRIWILDNLPEPNWKRELILCTKYLELDERNFHCWDYRKTVAQRANIPDHLEYEYTLEKIKANFSNYSAWHLRSKLLPKIFPDVENNLPITESKHKEELELVQNAAFTDPNDQSAWFYQQWLLGITEPKIHFSAVQATENQVFVSLSKSIQQNEALKFQVKINLKINDLPTNGFWKNSNGKTHSSVWIYTNTVNFDSDDILSLTLGEVEYESLVLKPNTIKICEPKFVPTFSRSLMEILIEQLSSCEQLLDLEPDSKWTLLTSILLKRSIDLNSYQNEIANDINKLIKVDPLRQGYYEDFSSKLKFELEILNFYNGNHLSELSSRIHSLKFSLIDKNVSSLYHMQYLMLLEQVDLSGNNLKAEVLSNLHSLQNCKDLNLNNNKIQNLKHLPFMSKLECLWLNNNLIEKIDICNLDKIPNLKYLSVENNPIVNQEKGWIFIKEKLIHLTVNDGKSN